MIRFDLLYLWQASWDPGIQAHYNTLSIAHWITPTFTPAQCWQHLHPQWWQEGYLLTEQGNWSAKLICWIWSSNLFPLTTGNWTMVNLPLFSLELIAQQETIVAKHSYCFGIAAAFFLDLRESSWIQYRRYDLWRQKSAKGRGTILSVLLRRKDALSWKATWIVTCLHPDGLFGQQCRLVTCFMQSSWGLLSSLPMVAGWCSHLLWQKRRWIQCWVPLSCPASASTRGVGAEVGFTTSD